MFCESVSSSFAFESGCSEARNSLCVREAGAEGSQRGKVGGRERDANAILRTGKGVERPFSRQTELIRSYREARTQNIFTEWEGGLVEISPEEGREVVWTDMREGSTGSSR